MDKYLWGKKLMECLSWHQLSSPHLPTGQQHGEGELGIYTPNSPKCTNGLETDYHCFNIPQSQYTPLPLLLFTGCFFYTHTHPHTHTHTFIYIWNIYMNDIHTSSVFGYRATCPPFTGSQMTALPPNVSHPSLGLCCLQLQHLPLLQDFHCSIRLSKCTSAHSLCF